MHEISVGINNILKDITIDFISEEAMYLARKYGYAPYMVERYLRMLGYEEALKLIESFENFRKRIAILCNYLRYDCDKLSKKLENMNFVLKNIQWCNYCLYIETAPSSPSIGSTHEYLKGYYYVYRDQASLIPPLILNPEKNSITLDMCAAPGGKAAHIMLLMEDTGLLIANDISRRRSISLLSHFIRMGFKSYVVINENAIELVKKFGKEKFDYVLLDAPCSAEGGIMFDPSRKTKTSIEVLAKLVEREIKLLHTALQLVKRGGRVVYTTCSIAPEENEYVVTKVLEHYDGIEVEEPRLNYWSNGFTKFLNITFDYRVSKCIRIWPHRHFMEGYFICSLVKT